MHRLVFLKRHKIILLIIALGLVIYYLITDFTRYPGSLDQNFRDAGSNQSELKKVIRHYSRFATDSLKRKAAIFLIENMDAHSSYESDEWEKFQKELYLLLSKEYDKNRLINGFDSIYKKYDLSDVRYLSDLKTIKAAFLIRSIDYAFEKWKTPYAKHLTFDEFCEYILPYRAGNEPLVNWQEEFNKKYIPAVFSLIKKTKDSISSEDICKALRVLKDGSLHFPPQDVPDYNVQLLLATKVATCREYCLKILLASRCIGVPVALDFTPQWGTRSMGHEWNALITKEGKPLSFGIMDDCKLGEHIELIKDRIPPKVYRETFAKQKESLAMIHGMEEIPPTLASPCMKDVTKDYYPTVDVPVKFIFNPPAQHRFAYLAVFNNQDWIPVCWAKVHQGEAVFKDLHKGILYMPGYYFKGHFMPASYPVIIDNSGKLKVIKPEVEKKQTLVLSRKYQIGLVDTYCKGMVGGKFQVSNDSDFVNAINLYEIKEKPEGCYQIVNIKHPKAYKYFRYFAPKQSPCNVAELEVYEANSNSKLIGNITGGCLTKYDLNVLNDFELSKVSSYIRKLSMNNRIFTFTTPGEHKFFAFPFPKQIIANITLTKPNRSELTKKQSNQLLSPHPVLPDTCSANAFDGDVLTNYCRYGKVYTWVGLEFDSPKQIRKIIYLPRNDDNCIRNGELYEMFYWDKEWISLGQQTGSSETYRLTYKNTPRNALFLLRNLTKGKEERIFTYEKGKQVWW